MSFHLLKILIIFGIIYKYHSYIVIYIKGNDPYELFNNSKSKDFTEYYLYSSINNNLYTLIGIGNPNQNVAIKINPSQKDFIFNENNCKAFYNDRYINKNKLSPNNITSYIYISNIGYNRKLSKSFNKNEGIKLDSSYNENYFSGNEMLKLDDYRNILTKNVFNDSEKIYPYSQDHLIKFNFVYEKNDNIDEICGSIGLAIFNDKNNNKFIEQLKTSNITQNYYWSIKYISLDKGYIIFGILPHQYLSSNETFNEINFLEIYSKFTLKNNQWGIDFNEIFFYLNNNKKEKILINKEEDAVFSFTNQLIIRTLNYKSTILSHFFNTYFKNNICIEETFSGNISYSIIKCDKYQFIKEMYKFPDLYLYNKELQTYFILSYKDLFITLDNNIYFMIIFRNSLIQQKKEIWELGIPFLKKYQIIFNSDTKKIGYYSNINVNKIESPKVINSKKSNIFNFSTRTLLEIFFGVILILLIIYLIKKIYVNKTRQKKPYELQEEDYDYFTINKKNRKNFVDVNNMDDNELVNEKIIEMERH